MLKLTNLMELITLKTRRDFWTPQYQEFELHGGTDTVLPYMPANWETDGLSASDPLGSERFQI